MTTPLMVGIAGGSSSGKTTVAQKLKSALAEYRVAMIDQDAYYRDLSHLTLVQRREVNFDHPDAFDTDLLLEDLGALKSGKCIQKPVYNFVTSTREPATILVEPSDLILLEGILVLQIDSVREQLDVRLFVDTEDDIRIIRRLTRDVKERGRSLDHVLGQYLKHVRPMHLGFVEPSKRHADIIVPRGGHNDAAIDMLVGALRGRLALRTPM
jgi:uridine kinase